MQDLGYGFLLDIWVRKIKTMAQVDSKSNITKSLVYLTSRINIAQGSSDLKLTVYNDVRK